MTHHKNVFITSVDTLTGFKIAKVFAECMHQTSGMEVCGGYTEEKSPIVQELQKMGVKVHKMHLDDPTKLQEMFDKSHCAVIVPPIHCENMKHYVENIVKAVEKSKVDHSTFISVINIDSAKHGILQEVYESEQVVKKCAEKANICIARLGFFLEKLLMHRHEITEEKKLSLPTGKGQFAPFSLSDFVKAMMKGKSEFEDFAKKKGMKVCITGQHKMTTEQLVQAARQSLTGDLKYEDVEPGHFKKVLKERHSWLDEREIQLMLDIFQMIRQNQFDEVTNDLEEMLGEKPMDPQEFFEKNKQKFKESHQLF